MKKSTYVLPMVSLMVFIAACSPPSAAPASQQKTPDEKRPQQSVEQKNDQNANAKTTITWLQWWKTEVGEEPLKQVKEAFEQENPDIELNIEDLPYAQVHDKIITLNLAGSPPDVITIQSPWVIEFAEAGISYPLNDFFNQMPEDYKKGVEGPLWVPWKNNYTGIPFYTGNVAQFYNKKKLEAANVKPPETWEELLEVSKKLTDPSKKQYALTGNISAEPATTATYEIWPLILQAGGKIIENNRAAFNTEQGVKALEFYKSLVKQYKVTTPGELSAGEKEKRANFSSENTALMFEGPWGIGIQNKANPGLEFGVAPLPKGVTHGTVVTGSLLGISAKSKQKEAAWKFISFMGGVKGQLIWAKSANYFPHNKEAMKDEFVQNNVMLKVFANQFEAGNAVGVDLYLPLSSDLRKVFMNEVQMFVSDKKSAKQALDDAAAEWNKVFEKYDN
ncbi:ABC transporter substrate-binding protein [Paenibacillus naphthalenovorans]|uniref:ABC transporter substrate-binding protein n=1 Tax=Paenibacillus naphthalenovorans TaxID=162209 RepID=UPI003D2B94DC